MMGRHKLTIINKHHTDLDKSEGEDQLKNPKVRITIGGVKLEGAKSVTINNQKYDCE